MSAPSLPEEKSEETKKTRASRVKSMLKMLGVKRVQDVFKLPNLGARFSNISGISEQYKKNLLDTLLSLWDVSVEKTRRKKIVKYWTQLKSNIENRTSQNVLSSKIKKSGVTFAKIKNRFKKEVNNEHNYKSIIRMRKLIVLSIYATLEPKRLDFADMRIVKRNISDCNFFNVSKGHFVFCKYKTSRKYGVRTQVVDKAYVEFINRTLSAYPRKHFIPTSGDTPMPESTFSRLVKSTFLFFFDEPLNANDLRHMYIIEFSKRNPTYMERKELSSRMMHSIDMQLKYDQFRHRKKVQTSKTSDFKN